MRKFGRTQKAKELKKYGKAWTGRRVITETHKDEVKAILKSDWEADPGTRRYLEYYQKAVTKVMERRSDEEIEEANVQASAWNTEVLPEKI